MLGNERRRERRKKITHRALVSFLWQPEDYYHTLPFIIKGIVLMGSETLWEEGKMVCRIFSSQLSQKETEWMNECEQNYTDQFSDKRIFCSEFVTSGDGELNQWPLKNPQNQALDQFPFNNINFRDYPVSKHAPQQIAGWLGSRPPQFRGWASPHWIKQTRWKRKQEGKVNINSKRSWFTSTR